MFRSVVATLLLGIVFFLAKETEAGLRLIHPDVKYMLGFYLAISFVIDQLMTQGFRNKREKFVQFYLAITTIRLVACCLFVGVFLYNGVENVRLFVIDFFVLYLFYTSFEIWGIYRKLRAN